MRKNVENQIYEIEKEIATLPSGSITSKTINSKVYFYHRVTVNGKRKENYIDKDLKTKLEAQIRHRKALEKKLKELKTLMPNIYKNNKNNNAESFKTYVRIGEELQRYVSSVKSLKKRNIYYDIKHFIYEDTSEKVLILYGLRRTGKTILIRQTIVDMNKEDFSKCAFIQIKYSSTLADVNEDLKLLESKGFKYIFIDEVTLLEDFISGSALFSDIYASSGMKIVLSGTDSLGFIFSEDEQLFDRCFMIHTTFIPYHEFENVLGIKGIDEYIRYGGTMSLSGTDYNDNSIFSSFKKTNEYIDNAIAKNIQHSLNNYQNGSHFRNLKELFDQNELTSAINRVIEDMNHRFTIETMTKTFESNDLSLSARNLRQDRKSANNILDLIDTNKVTKRLKDKLDILNIVEQKVNINDAHVSQIKEYLRYLDIIMDVPVHYIPNYNQRGSITVITQHGIRYVQALELVDSLSNDEIFKNLNANERSLIIERIKNEIKGRMMKEIVLLETKLSKTKMQVFKLEFAVGEFDMVIFDPQNISCEIFEIKHSTEINPIQYRHLIDERKCNEVKKQYGSIKKKYVIYRGRTCIENDIQYLNVEEYLNSLKHSKF